MTIKRRTINKKLMAAPKRPRSPVPSAPSSRENSPKQNQTSEIGDQKCLPAPFPPVNPVQNFPSSFPPAPAGSPSISTVQPVHERSTYFYGGEGGPHHPRFNLCNLSFLRLLLFEPIRRSRSLNLKLETIFLL
jgi:hypothetical protein